MLQAKNARGIGNSDGGALAIRRQHEAFVRLAPQSDENRMQLLLRTNDLMFTMLPLEEREQRADLLRVGRFNRDFVHNPAAGVCFRDAGGHGSFWIFTFCRMSLSSLIR